MCKIFRLPLNQIFLSKDVIHRQKNQTRNELLLFIIIIITIFKHGTISQYIKYLQKRKKKSDLPIGRVLNYYINIKKSLLLINL